MMGSRVLHVTLAATAAVAAVAVPGLRLCAPAFAHEGAYEIRSTAAGGGALAVTGVPDEPVAVGLIFCSGGECLYENAETSIHAPEGDLASPALFALTDGTPLTLELVSLDEGVAIKVGSKKLDQPGDSASLGTAPTLHAEPVLQVTATQGVVGEWAVAFRVTSSPSAYAASESIAIVLTNEPHVCGDGHLDEHEACDAGDEAWSSGRACTDHCEWLACGDPDGDGQPRASDALFVLSAAVGVHACDSCLCDVDASGGGAPISGVDALRLLSAAVGMANASLECPACE